MWTAPRTARTLALSALAALAPVAAAAAQAFTAAAAYGTTPATPAPAPAASAMRGVFRVHLQKGEAMTIPATLMIERRDGQLEASLIVDHHISALQVLRADGDTLEALVRTEAGLSTLRLRVTGDAVDGTLAEKRSVWKVRGERSA